MVRELVVLSDFELVTSQYPVRRVDRGPAVQAWQTWLSALGYGVGPVDGIFGPLTEQATRDFQTVVQTNVTGIVNVSDASLAFQEYTRFRAGQRTQFQHPATGPGLIGPREGRGGILFWGAVIGALWYFMAQK